MLMGEGGTAIFMRIEINRQDVEAAICTKRWPLGVCQLAVSARRHSEAI
jgi:hypothetical protein